MHEHPLKLRDLPRLPVIYKGWWVVSAPFLGAALATGAGQYGFGVFIEPLEETFGWSRSQISASLSFTAVGSIIAPFLGRIMDRHGTLKIMAISLIMISLSYVLRPFMTDLWQWYALSLLQYAGYTGATMLTGGKLVGMWFQRTRGRAMGITAMGNNFGGFAIPPLLGALLPLVSWEGSYVVLGILSIGLVPYSLLVVRDFPSASEVESQRVGRANGENSFLTGASVSQALGTRGFYAISVSIVLGTFTYSAILPQVITHLTDVGVSVTIAAFVLSLFAICGMIGKFLMGLLAERITSRYALMANFAGQATFLVAMIWAENPAIMWISVPIYGFFNGAFGALFQLVVQDAFGVRHYGGIMGLINMATVVSFGIGPILAGASFDITGSYTAVFLGVAVLFVVAALSLTQATVDLDTLSTESAYQRSGRA